MTVPTQPVTVNLADFGGPAIEGVVVKARLTDIDYTSDGVFVSTKTVTATTDATGVAVLNVFPNAPPPDGLGTRNTRVLFTASIPRSRDLRVFAIIPDAPCNLVDVQVEDEDIESFAYVPPAILSGFGDLRSYAGNRNAVYLTGAGIEGLFFMDSSDTTSADNNDTVIVDSRERRWKRIFDGEAIVADYTALRAYSGHARSVRITGYLVTAAPSGTAGLFTRDDNDTTSADNGGTIIVATNGKRWKRIYNGRLNPEWFGADRTGVADSAAAIQAAINIGPTELREGSFRVNSTITLPANTNLIGAGPRETTINASNLVGQSLFYADPAGVSFLYVADLKCVGSSSTGALGSGHCFNFISPNGGTGTNTPQVSLLENLDIDQFRGFDQGTNGATVTITNATPAVVTWTAHGFANDQTVRFTTTGTLPAGLSANTQYYVRNVTANTFEVSLTAGGASIATTSAGSGVHTAYYSIASCAVMQYGTLAVTCRKVYADDCGHGFYMRRTQNCRIDDCLSTNTQYTAIFAYDNQNLIVNDGDFNDSHLSGTAPDPGYPAGVTGDTDMAGLFLSHTNTNLVVTGTKLKGFRGKALMVFKGTSYNLVVTNNWIRGDSQTAVPHKAIYAVDQQGLEIKNNTFFPSNTGLAAAYETIEIYGTSLNNPVETTITGNTFIDAASMNIDYNIKVTGNANTRTHRITIAENRFGSSSSLSGPCTVATDILLMIGTLVEGSFIGRNTHVAPTNVTRTACVSFNGAFLRGTTIGPSVFSANGGTITANYSQMAETEAVSADKANTSPTLVAGTSERTTIYNSVLTGDRTVTLSATAAVNGDRKRIVRTASATGNFKVNVVYSATTLIALDAGQECEVLFNGTAWILASFGTHTYEKVADYTALRAYAGVATQLQVTGFLAAAAPSGIAGTFVRDDADTTSADNGGTIIVAANGKRWKRLFTGPANVIWFGAKGDGTTDDTASIQAAINAHSQILFPGKRFSVTATAAGFNYGNSTTPVYRALNIDKSDLTIIGEKGATLLLKGVDDPGASGEINYVFSTAKNMVLGTLSNIRIRGLDFDFNPTGTVGTTYRSFHIVGARGVELHDLYLYSSGSRYGATITVQNSEQVRLSNIRMRNVTQGMNFSYVDDVEFSDIMLDYFSEGIDFDRMVSRCKANNVTFTSTFGGLSGQCWDLNSVRDSTISNVSAYRCGNVAYVNFKQTTAPTYADYVNNAAISTYTPSRNVTLDGFNIHTCAQDAVAAVVGDDADTDPGVLTRDITLRNFHMVASGGLEVRAAINVLVDGFTSVQARPSTAAGWAVIFALQGTRLNAKCSIALRNITIKDIANSQDAIRLSGVDCGYMDNLHIENYPLEAVEVSNPAAGALITITNSRFLRTVDTVVTGTAVRFTSFSSGQISLNWFNNQITQYTTPFAVTGVNEANAVPKRRVSLGQQVLTSGTKRFLCWADPLLSAYVTMVKPVSGLAIPADATNYVAYNLKREDTSSVCSGSDTAGAAAGVPVDIGFTPPEALATVNPGGTMYLEAIAQGTGRTIDAYEVHVHALEYLRV